MKSRISKTNAIHLNYLAKFKKEQLIRFLNSSFSRKKDPRRHTKKTHPLNHKKVAQMFVYTKTNGNNQETLTIITRDSVAIQTGKIYMLLEKNPQFLSKKMSYNNNN